MDDKSTQDAVESSIANGRPQPRAWGLLQPWGHRLTWPEWIAVAFGVGAVWQSARARGNYVTCAFLPLLIPTLLIVFSKSERGRALRFARRLWSQLEDYRSGGKTPWTATIAFVIVPAFLLYLSNDHVSPIGDTSTVVPTAISLVREGNTDLDEFYGDGFWWFSVPAEQRQDGISYFLRKRAAHLYPAHPSGTVSLALPVVLATKFAGARLSEPGVHLRLEKLTASLAAAVSLGVFLWLALHLAPTAPALVTTAILTIASGMFSTVGQNLWQHDGIILGSLIVLLFEFRRGSGAGTVAQGLICGTLLACRLTAVTFLVPFGLWVLFRSPRRAAVIVLSAVIAWLPWIVYYLTIYGSVFGPSYSTHLTASHWSANLTSRLLGVMISPGRGLLVYQPWILLSLFAPLPKVRHAVETAARSTAPKGWAIACVAAIVLEIAVVSAWHCWWGGWCWGSRLVMSVVPLCALLCVRPIAALLTTYSGRFLVIGLGLLGTFTQLPGVYDDVCRWSISHADAPERAIASWSDAPFLSPFKHSTRIGVEVARKKTHPSASPSARKPDEAVRR